MIFILALQLVMQNTVVATSLTSKKSIKFNQPVKIAPIPEPNKSQTRKSDAEECGSPKCESCHPYGDVCIKCIKQFYLNSSGKCADCLPNCDHCENGIFCDQCKKGHELTREDRFCEKEASGYSGLFKIVLIFLAVFGLASLAIKLMLRVGFLSNGQE
jgi:hypothetical protein